MRVHIFSTFESSFGTVLDFDPGYAFDSNPDPLSWRRAAVRLVIKRVRADTSLNYFLLRSQPTRIHTLRGIGSMYAWGREEGGTRSNFHFPLPGAGETDGVTSALAPLEASGELLREMAVGRTYRKVLRQKWILRTSTWNEPGGKRKRGRPRKRRIEDIKAITGKYCKKKAMGREIRKMLEVAFTQEGVPVNGTEESYDSV
ncbi:hypothetical protein EVAR_48779_1 [Eumeta japonica]|uniref:Uncharacterized protein n=1 Tax=Eumeta variegata TaxID=151549 RepID=A0A4C1Y4J5_EUMVA|nr:hypothetical protein EVAR_48779_1 [Eumeta japonica]